VASIHTTCTLSSLSGGVLSPEHWTCPYCNRDVILNAHYSTVTETVELNLENADGFRKLLVRLTVCPNKECRRTSLRAVLAETEQATDERGFTSFKTVGILQTWSLIPRSNAKVFPTYVPQAVRDDYEEACAIRDTSPKAAATLARRALQGMIRDFWRVKAGNLVDEIDALKGRVEPEVWDALTAVRKVGNIGAHMEKDVNLIIDVEPQEAETLIGLIEMLIKEWYISRENRKAALANVTAIAAAKASAKTVPRPAKPKV
jgi:hypothetical protein